MAAQTGEKGRVALLKVTGATNDRKHESLLYFGTEVLTKVAKGNT